MQAAPASLCLLCQHSPAVICYRCAATDVLHGRIHSQEELSGVNRFFDSPCRSHWAGEGAVAYRAAGSPASSTGSASRHATDSADGGVDSDSGVGSPQHGLCSNQMAMITSYFDPMRIHDHQMNLITSDCVPF